MALVNAGLAMLTVGYILGVWTACAIFRERQKRDSHLQPTPAVIWISEPRR